MKLFVSWTTRDPVYHEFDPEAYILVSPHGVPKKWNTSLWSTLPKELFVDSGAFTKTSELPTVEDVLLSQLSITARWDEHKKLFFSHPDLILPPASTYNESNSLINQSLERAKRYLDLLHNKQTHALPVGVMHGFDEESLLGSYYELKEVGYQHFALGSLALRFSKNKNSCLKAIEIITDYEVSPLHIFGVSWPMHEECRKFNIDSFDCSSPAKLGFYGSVLYGTPLKRYVIAPSAKQKLHDTFFTFRTSIDKPLPCTCPICSDDPNRLIPHQGTKAKKDRALHNYFQLKWATKKFN